MATLGINSAFMVQVGSQVCIDGEPQCGWGKAHPWSVGKLREIDDDIFVVDFPEHKSWKVSTKVWSFSFPLPECLSAANKH
jgi:hypothetical protein